MNPLALFPPLGGRSGRSGRGSVDAGGEERLLEPAGVGHLCCLGVYPGGGWQPGGGDGIPGLLRRHPGAEELAVFGETEGCPSNVSTWRRRRRSTRVLRDREHQNGRKEQNFPILIRKMTPAGPLPSSLFKSRSPVGARQAGGERALPQNYL